MFSVFYVEVSFVFGNAGVWSVLRIVLETLVYNRQMKFEYGNCSVEVDWV